MSLLVNRSPELRRLAEAFLNERTEERKYLLDEFYAAADPLTIVALLDRIAALEGAVEALLSAMALNRWAAERAIKQHGSAAAAHESGPLPDMDAASKVMFAAEDRAHAALKG